MKKMKWLSGFLLPVMACCFVACGDDNDEPDNSGNSGVSAGNVLTIDGSKWIDPKITVFDDSYGDYYFTYMAFDTTNGTRNFNFNVDSYFDEAGEDVAEDIEIQKLGNLENIVTYSMDTEYISGSVIVESIGENSIVLNFKNYECYYYPSSRGPGSQYKHTISGKVKFTRDGE